MLFFAILGVYTLIAYGKIENACAAISDENYNEELVVRPLADHHVNTYFQFSTSWQYGHRKNLHNTNLVPRVVADLLLEFDIKELHISLTQGAWLYKDWGYPIVDAASGIEIWAWFYGKELTNERVDEQWIKLTNAFSGILCASLNFIDKSNSVAPLYSFRPGFVTSQKNLLNANRFIRYATLPREIVCTENLTPWKKLLPCGSALGFASLLNSGNVHNTKFHSLSLSLRTICGFHQNADYCNLQLSQTANLVYDLKILEGNRNDFSLRRLFGQGLQGSCALAQTSLIYVLRSEEGAKYDLSPAAPHEIITTRGGFSTIYAVYDLKLGKHDERLFNIAWLERKQIHGNEALNLYITEPPLIYIQRYLLGTGQQKGRLITEIVNTHVNGLPIILLEVIPWFVSIFINTLKIETKSINNTSYNIEGPEPKMLHYVPCKQRQAPTHLEIGIVLPSKSVTRIAINCDFLMLKWLEYPPDAHHGHYIGSSTITVMLPNGRNYTAIPSSGQLFTSSFNTSITDGYVQLLHTKVLVVSLPTPDFSMPYNVICLACTVVVLAFGPIHSVATKRIVVESGEFLARYLMPAFIKRLFKRKNTLLTSAPSPVMPTQ